MEKNNKKVINAWCSYDIANSVYNLIINTVLFPIYFKTVTEKQFGGEIIQFLGFDIKNTVLYDYTLSLAYLIIVFCSPILSGIADYGGKRKRFMQFFSFMGAASCFSFYWFTGNNLGIGIFLMILGVIGFAGSLLFYNSFLPQIATPEHHDRISAKGYAWGYTGSVLLLIFNLITIEKFEMFGFSTKLEALRFSFLEVGVWWFLIAQIAFLYLKDHETNHKITTKIIGKGYNELRQVFKNLSHQVNTKRFLLAFFFYSMGVQTLMLMAIMFGTSELGIKGSKLIITIVILQVVAIIGATFFGYISQKKGNKISLISMLLIWLSVCIGAFFIYNEYQFYIIAAMVGLVMGGIQSQSRSTYSKLIPEDTVDNASYFSFYDVSEKLAIVLGTFSFGFVEHISGSMRNSALVLGLFFVIGLVIVLFTKLPQSIKPEIKK